MGGGTDDWTDQRADREMKTEREAKKDIEMDGRAGGQIQQSTMQYSTI